MRDFPTMQRAVAGASLLSLACVCKQLFQFAAYIPQKGGCGISLFSASNLPWCLLFFFHNYFPLFFHYWVLAGDPTASGLAPGIPDGASAAVIYRCRTEAGFPFWTPPVEARGTVHCEHS